MRKQILKQKNKIFAVGDQMIVSGTNFMVGIMITRFVGVESYGRFALYWMVFLFLQGLCNAFIGLPAQVISTQYKNQLTYLENNNRLGAVLLIVLLPILYFVFYVYDVIADVSFGYGYWLFPIVILLFLKHEMNRKYFYAQEAIKKVILIDICTYLLQLPVLAFLVYINKINLNSLLVIFGLSAIIGQIVFYLLKNQSAESFQFKKLPIAENWYYARHLIFTAILQWFSGNILLVSAGSIIGVGAVGIIRILQNIMGILHVLFLTLENVVPVKASWLLNNHGKKYMMTYFKKIVLVTGIIYALSAIGLKWFGADLLQILYGAEYVEYTHLLSLFIGVYILVFIGTLAQILIKTMKLNYGILLAYLITVTVALLLATPLLRRFQIEGVILGFAILQTISIGVYFFILKRALI